jgi:hypothetical protein
MLLDRVVPYRFLVLLLMVGFEVILLCFVVQYKNCSGSASPVYAPFPRRKLLVMACLDLTKVRRRRRRRRRIVAGHTVV